MLKSYGWGGVGWGGWPIRLYCHPSPLDLGFGDWGLGTGLGLDNSASCAAKPILLALPCTLQQRQYNGPSRILHYTLHMHILLFDVHYIWLEIKLLTFLWRLKFLS